MSDIKNMQEQNKMFLSFFDNDINYFISIDKIKKISSEPYSDAVRVYLGNGNGGYIMVEDESSLLAIATTKIEGLTDNGVCYPFPNSCKTLANEYISNVIYRKDKNKLAFLVDIKKLYSAKKG